MIGAFEQAMLTILVACMMLGMGAAMTARDVRRELKRPKWLVLAVIGQFTFMPLIAFGLVQVFDIPPAIAIGLVILGFVIREFPSWLAPILESVPREALRLLR